MKIIGFIFKIIGDGKILVEKKVSKEYCQKCKSPLENIDYVYRRRDPWLHGYVCSKCGNFEFYYEE